MATVSPVLWKKSLKDGTRRVKVRISHEARTVYLNTPVRARPSDWDSRSGRIKPKVKGATKSNVILQELIAKTLRAIDLLSEENVDLDAMVIKERVEGGNLSSRKDLFVLFDEHIHLLASSPENSLHTADRYASIRRKLGRFLGRESLLIHKLTPALVHRFDRWMVTELGNQKSTRAAAFRAIRAVIGYGQRVGVVARDFEPLRGVDYSEPRSPKRYLRRSEITSLRELELVRGSRQDHARDAWLFSMSTAGMRFGDLCRLQWKDIHNDGDAWRVRYVMNKSERLKDMNLTPHAVAIVKKYEREDRKPTDFIFPFLPRGFNLNDRKEEKRQIASMNALANKSLRQIQAKMELADSFSFHNARHTWAYHARKSGLNMWDIMKSLGHGSLKVTERYLENFDFSEIDVAVNSVEAYLEL